jgi:molybdenum cofactor cytidylyltransferase
MSKGTNHFAAIVLAAGLSRRMRRFKPLLPLDGQNVTDFLIGTFLKNDVDVVLVAGYLQDRLRQGLETPDIQIVVNPHYRQGMFSSIQAGLRTLETGYQAAFIAPVDIPLVRPSTIHSLLQAAIEYPGKILYPTFRRSRGHPPLIPAAVFPLILEEEINGNLKSLLLGLENLAAEIPVPDSHILIDIDTPSDYQRLLEGFQRYEVPSPEECEVILQEIRKVTPSVYRHSLKVARIAEAIGHELIARGIKLDLPAVRAAARLHDIAKGQKGHAAAGASWLAEKGFGKTGDMVAVHTDLPAEIRYNAWEAKIVYLSNKFVDGEKEVSLQERYNSALKRYGLREDIRSEISRRCDRALQVKTELESLLGFSLEKIISQLKAKGA